MTKQECNILFVDPFHGGSHKLLIDTLTANLEDYKIVSLPAKKWHWRARCGALMLYDQIPQITTEKIIFCSSVLNLAELLGIRPDLQHLKKVVYFHENQFIYPVREIKQRDVQYTYNQITTCIAANKVLFNSHFNRNTFLENINRISKLIPDYKPKNLRTIIENKSEVIYFPVDFPETPPSNRSPVLHIVWPHRWEFDKGPEHFFHILFKLKDASIPFKLSILGESFTDNPEIFTTAKEYLKEEIINFGYCANKDDYYKILSEAHVVVSTARHEFFGVSMLEAFYCGCFPLAPNVLVYPEIYPPECLFSDETDLYNRLKQFALNTSSIMEARSALNFDFTPYCSNTVLPLFKNMFRLL